MKFKKAMKKFVRKEVYKILDEILGQEPEPKSNAVLIGVPKHDTGIDEVLEIISQMKKPEVVEIDISDVDHAGIAEFLEKFSKNPSIDIPDFDTFKRNVTCDAGNDENQ